MSIGQFFSDAIAEGKKVFAVIETNVHKVVTDIDQAAPLIESLTTEVAAFVPQAQIALTAEKASVAILDAVDAAIQGAGNAAATGVTVALPAELVAQYQTARTTVVANVNTIKAAIAGNPNPVPAQ